ncbi:methyltransferase domain-containing protein [Pelagibacteraceae bacterium]|nr:methyltransferase domain-containing protein [Pelagibacteraceae bacterium]MDC3156324.1 methyltransferase domain-containing protein [Pelagibacteraceae bacterium]
MINKKYLKLLRSKDRKYGENFIYNEISKNIIDSLDILKVPFDNILQLGINDNLVINYLKERFPSCSITSADIDLSVFTKKTDQQLIEIDLDNIQIKDSKFDLIFSNFFCQLTSNFEKLIENIFQSLNSNGFFIATIPSAENTYQLINSMYETDNILYGGMYQRVNPILDTNDIFKILKLYKFDAPLINNNNFTIEYSVFKKLLDDIRCLNLPYAGKDKKNNFENKKYFIHLEKQFKKKYYRNNFNIDVNFNTICAWKK